MFLYIVTFDLIGKVVHVFLQLFQHVIWIERAFHDLRMLRVFQVHLVLQYLELVIALVVESQKNTEHRFRSVWNLFELLPVHRQYNLKIPRRQAVICPAVIRITKGAIYAILGPSAGWSGLFVRPIRRANGQRRPNDKSDETPHSSSIWQQVLVYI